MLRNWKRIGIKTLPYLLIALFTLILLSVSLKSQSFIGGLDTNFHMNGFYEAARQIATGHYSYFMSLFGFNQSGRIVNAIYGPVFNYLGGSLLLICHSWIRFQLWLLFITITVAGVGMYLVARKCRINAEVALILAFLYMMSHPIIASWFGNSEFMGLGAAIMPFLIMSGVDIVRYRRINVWSLALPMAILLQIHLMSSLIVALALVPFGITCLIVTSHRAETLRNGLLSIILATVLSGNVWGAIYDVYSSNHLIPTFPVFNMQSMNNSLRINSNHIMIPAGAFVLAIVLIYAIVRHKKLTDLDWILLIDGLGFLWLSTAYFPWNHLLRSWPIISSVIQFPTRFLPVALLTLLLMFGRIMTRMLDWAMTSSLPTVKISGIGMVLLLIFVVNLAPTMHYVNWLTRVWRRPYVVRYSGSSAFRRNGPKLRRSFGSHDLHRGLTAVNKITTDYLPTPRRFNQKAYYRAPTYSNFNRDFINNPVRVRRRITGHQMMLSWRLPASIKPYKSVILPIVSYQHSVIRLNGNLIKPRQTLVGAVRLESRTGWVNHLTVRYQPGILFRIMSGLAIVGWIISLSWLLLRKHCRRLVKFIYKIMKKIPA